jgi:hypothetical protein
MASIIFAKSWTETYRLVIRRVYVAEERSSGGAVLPRLLFCHLQLAERKLIPSKMEWNIKNKKIYEILSKQIFQNVY